MKHLQLLLQLLVDERLRLKAPRQRVPGAPISQRAVSKRRVDDEERCLVRRAVGPGSQAAKLAEHISLRYFHADDHFEVDVDIASSSLACSILSIVKTATKNVVLDLA